MSALENKAQLLVAHAAPPKEGVVIDSNMILAVVALLNEIIALYRSCYRTPQMTATNMNKPGLVARRRLRKLIESREWPAGVSVQQLHAAALEVGKTCTVAEVEEMYATVQ